MKQLANRETAKGKAGRSRTKTEVQTTPPYITNYLAEMHRSDREYGGDPLHEEPTRRRKVDIWMPMYWPDYYKDTMDLSTLEHGAYMLLIGNYWVRQGPLPNDDVRLSNMTRLTLEEWGPIRRRLELFFEIRNGSWHHKRIDAEILKAMANREAKSNAGKASAEKRCADKANNKAGTERGTDAVAETQQKGNPSPVPSSASIPLTAPSSPKLVLQAPEALSRGEEPVFEDMTEQQFIDCLEDLFSKPFMVKHGGSWRLRIRENKSKVISVVRELRSMQREGKHIRHPGACANDLWKRFAK